MAWSITEEHRRQGICHGYLDRALPPGALVTAIDHASKSSPAAWQRMLKRGIRPGISDWYVFWQGRTVWAEQKAPKGPTSENQLKFGQRAVENGAAFGVFVTLGELHDILVSAGIPALPPSNYEVAKMEAGVPKERGASKRSRGARKEAVSPARVRRVEAMRSKVMF